MQHEYITYTHNDTELEGYFAYPVSAATHTTKSHPLILVAPDWRGRTEFACEKANELANLGYAAFALDLYGKGIVGKSVEENSALMSPLMADRNLLRQRLLLALTTAKQHPIVNTAQIGAIGFCFGGLCVLDLARSGVDLKGVVSFHGLFLEPTDIPQYPIKAKVLALHGYNDPMAPMSQVQMFAEEMQRKQVDWQIHLYGNTQHAFTNPIANDPQLGTVYNPVAAKRSWQAMIDFFKELF